MAELPNTFLRDWLRYAEGYVQEELFQDTMFLVRYLPNGNEVGRIVLDAALVTDLIALQKGQLISRVSGSGRYGRTRYEPCASTR